MTRICWLQAGAEGDLSERGRCLEILQGAEAIWPSSASHWYRRYKIDVISCPVATTIVPEKRR